jgi:DNA-binding NtrC family response regulator
MATDANGTDTLTLHPPQPAAFAGNGGTALSKRILVVDDDEEASGHLQELLRANPQLEVDTCADGEEAIKELARHNYSIVITDLLMPGFDGMDLIREVQERRLPATVIVMTGHGSIDQAVRAIRQGAYDFLTKPIDIDNLRLVIARALRERSLQDEISHLRAQLQTRYQFQNILSKNAHMHAVFELIRNIADSNTTVLIEGETGTGKEQIARAVHQTSRARTGPLVALNCTAVPETLLESELFGHEKGSFTGAVAQRRGRFELANGGTLFLDEIGDVPMTMQAKLLRVLQERRFERVGGGQPIEVDVRVIAATNRPLQRLVAQGTFREDLYYRINVVKIELPPLRERPEDIPLLATHFAEKYARRGESPKQLSPRAMEVLLNYHWPGNVRELENAIERACVTSRGEFIEPEQLPPEVLRPVSTKLPFHIDLDRPLPEILQELTRNVEEQYIRKALQKAHGHVGNCAKICHLSRRTVTAKIAEYGIKRQAFREG